MSSQYFLSYQLKRREVIKECFTKLVDYEDIVEVNNFEGLYESTDKTMQNLIIKEEMEEDCECENDQTSTNLSALNIIQKLHNTGDIKIRKKID